MFAPIEKCCGLDLEICAEMLHVTMFIITILIPAHYGYVPHVTPFLIIDFLAFFGTLLVNIKAIK